MPSAPKAASTPQLDVGDHAPVFSCNDAEGNLFEFYVSVTGKPVILIFCNGKDIGDVSEEFLSDISFDPEKTQILTIASGDPSAVMAQAKAADWPHRTLADANGEITSGFEGLSDVPAPSIYVLDPNQRLAGVTNLEEAGNELGTWLEKCVEGACHSAPPETVESIPPVLTVPRILEPEDCEWLIGLWKEGEKHVGQVAHGAESTDRKGVVRDIKRRYDYVVKEPDIEQRILQRVMPRLVPELKKIFHFHRWEMEALRVGCYKASDSGFFDVHRDNCNPSVQYRKYAVTINLNTGDYEGGVLRFPEYGNQEFAPPPGGAIVFSCSMLHEVLPVTKGERFVLLTFLTQPPT